MKKKLVTTSWDDGHILDMKLAELLNRYNLAATFYIAPEDHEIALDERLGRGQIAELSKKFEIGAHTMTHPLLSKINDAAAREEIRASKKTLEDMTGKPVTSFCYPSGDYTLAHKQMVRDAGFQLARTVKRFSTDIGNDPFALPTTLHAYRHWSDIAPIFREAGMTNFYKQYMNWDDLAIAMFEKFLVKGGIFHLWGHSWEIEKNGDWRRLERVFEHIADHSDIHYVRNKELV